MSLWKPVEKPKSPLARYRTLSPSAGIHVSPLQLGAMSIGDKWGEHMGSMNKESSFKLLDTFYALGGNFIDTANNYPERVGLTYRAISQDQSSEEFIGEWAEQRGIRDQLIIATKYSSNYVRGEEGIKQKVNYSGNNVKSMRISVDASLKKLRTSYIDILYVHWWDYDTSVEEVMNGLHVLVQQGKVLYLCNQYARDHGKSPFVIYQGAWNVMTRDFERDIIPMARVEGMALAPWNVLAGGKLRTDAEEERRRKTGEKGRTLMDSNWERTPVEREMSLALEKVAKEVGTEHITAVAIAYLMQKTPYVFPIVGGRKVEHLQGNLVALSITLTPEHIKYLDSVLPFDSGFPHNFIGDGTDNSFLAKSTAYLEKQPRPTPIKPSD
ncbi:NADP-dependent oxidoreductase domain-containing protein [Melanogaster broomeanus]|nr:NADP-dependent oxidoreductase domain-containing protein [Melanogaster broomeanus]